MYQVDTSARYMTSGALLANRLASGKPLALLCHAPASILAAASPDGSSPFAGALAPVPGRSGAEAAWCPRGCRHMSAELARQVSVRSSPCAVPTCAGECRHVYRIDAQRPHRAEGDTRIVPTHPELTRLLHDHLANFGPRPTTGASSPVCGAASRPLSPTAAPGSKPASWPSPGGRSLSPRSAAIRPAARLPVHLAERRRLPHPGSRMGRAQRGRTAAHPRQVHRGPRRARQAPHRPGPAP